MRQRLAASSMALDVAMPCSLQEHLWTNVQTASGVSKASDICDGQHYDWLLGPCRLGCAMQIVLL